MKKTRTNKAARLLNLYQQGKIRRQPEPEVLKWLASLNSKNPSAALQEYQKVLRDNPKAEQVRASYYRQLVNLELKQELLSETVALLEKAPRDQLALSYRAHAERLLGRIDEAKETLEKLAKLAPNDPVTLNSLGSLVKELGDFDRAGKLLDSAIAIQPNYGRAYWNKSDISVTPESDLDKILVALGKSTTPDAERHYLHFSAYRLFEDRGNFDEAFQHLKLGNDLKRKALNYSVEADLHIDSEIQNFFSSEFFATENQRNDEESQPATIFIFGMPRSGTTLVEQIVASHSKVKGGNELSALGDATRAVRSEYHLSGGFPNWLRELPAQGWEKIADHYNDLTNPIRGDFEYLTDKALLNYKSAGLIQTSLPQAKLVLVDRDAMDVCFGCYRQLFNQGLRFSYRYDELARIYASYRNLIAHWENVLPGSILKVKYESLVHNPQEQIGAILDFCGLDHQDACFNPHQTKRAVRTLSAAQVRSPITTSGVARWKTYEQQLEPLRQALLSAGVSD